MLTDAHAYVKKCDKCQRFTPMINQPAMICSQSLTQSLFLIRDGHYRAIHTGIGERKFLIVGIDYFTKWIEEEPTAKIRTNQVKKFIWQNIITRFGIPMGIVMDHSVQFNCNPIKSFLSSYGIKFAYSSVCHPQSNGQAEATIKQILNALKKNLDDLKGATGRTWFQQYYGQTGPLKRKLPAKHLSGWHSGQKQYYRSK